MRVRRQAKRRTAFTLLELLVVVAVIALLISILLPSLRRARASAMRAACLSNLKAIAGGGRVYASRDPQGWSIPVHPGPDARDIGEPTYVGAYEWGGKSGIGRPDFLGDGSDPLDSRYGTRAGFGPATRPMNDLMYNRGFPNFGPREDLGGMRADTQLTLDLYTCPGDDGPPLGGHCPDWVRHAERSSYDHFGNSYAANLFMIRGGSSLESNSPYMRPITRVPTPARTLLFEENIGRWAWAAREDPCPTRPGVDIGAGGSIRGWHGRDWTFTRSFVDGHAAYQRIVEPGTENPDGYAAHYRIEALSSYPRWAGGQRDAAFWACFIVRGDGWAKDTLPAALVETGLPTVGEGRPVYEDCVGSR